ncbi:MAG: transcriptional repressor [Ignavibacteria bacterium]|nr:transcriptional repressor [Ignavibacteria bacterium]
MNKSNQREEIKKVAGTMKGHFTVEEVFFKVKTKIPSLSLATVYRNLKLLVKEDYLRELSFDDNILRYELKENEHYHFICEKCSKIFDILLKEDNLITKFTAEIKQPKINRLNCVAYGICQNCFSN